MMSRFNRHFLVATSVFSAFLSLSPAGAAECSASDTANIPAWAHNHAARGKQYRYYVGEQRGMTFGQTFQAALNSVLFEIKAEQSVEIDSVLEVINAVKSRGDTITESSELTAFTRSKVKGVVRGAEVHDVYVVQTCDDGPRYNVYLLVRIRRDRADHSVPDPIETSDIVWRSALVPGWGQLHAGHRSRGWFLLSTTVGGLAVGAITGILARNDHAEAGSQTRQSGRDYYDERASMLRTVSYITLAVAAGTYIYSLVDATTTPPTTQYYAERPRRRVSIGPFGLSISF